MLVAADEVIVVAAPDLANLRNAKNIIDNDPRRAAATTIRRVWSSTASACRSGRKSRSPTSPRRSRRSRSAIIPHDAKLFGAAANNGQMIAEVEPKGKVAETFGELAARDRRPRRDARSRSAACSIRSWPSSMRKKA